MSAFALTGALGLLGALVVVAWAVVAPEAALAAWLAAALFVTAIAPGALAFGLVAQLHRGRWTELTGDLLRRTAATLPAAALLLAPVLLFAGSLYGWAEPTGHRLGLWFAPEAFALRGLLYLAVWWLFARLLPAPGAARRPGLASGGLVAYALSASFAGFDWALSLQPEVYSSVFGMIFVSHQMLAGFAFVLLLAVPRAAGDAAALRGLGNMLFGGLMLWIYLEFMQYLVIWSGNLPHHVAYYMERAGGGWALVIYLLAVGGGLVPFLALLPAPMRRNARLLQLMAGLFLAARALEACWWVLPLYGADWRLLPLAHAAFVGAGGLWLAAWLQPPGRRQTLARRRSVGGHHG